MSRVRKYGTNAERQAAYRERKRRARDLSEFLNRLRILRSLDHDEVPEVKCWVDFRDAPCGYLISCPDDEAEHIWTALREREGE